MYLYNYIILFFIFCHIYSVQSQSIESLTEKKYKVFDGNNDFIQSIERCISNENVFKFDSIYKGDSVLSAMVSYQETSFLFVRKTASEFSSLIASSENLNSIKEFNFKIPTYVYILLDNCECKYILRYGYGQIDDILKIVYRENKLHSVNLNKLIKSNYLLESKKLIDYSINDLNKTIKYLDSFVVSDDTHYSPLSCGNIVLRNFDLRCR